MIGQVSTAQEAIDIIRIANDKTVGEYSKGVMKMTIVRPSWTREMELKFWTKGTDYSLMLLTAPARDNGTAFLKREKEIWNWQPTIDRVIKLPPSMMMQSWMGSDVTNDDLVKQSSIVEDYEHTLLGEEIVEDRNCWVIELIPKEEAAVVWGKVKIWVEQEEYLQLKVEFFDEEDFLVNTMYGKDVKMLGGRLLPAVLEIVPADDEGNKTIIKQSDMVFDEPIEERFFSVQNMKRIR
jgi:outer membrane lipoprotein-sorting protein